MKQSIALILFVVFFIACEEPKRSVVEKKSTMEAIDLDKKSELSMHDLFSNMEIIPLETTKKSVLGHPLKKLIVKDGLFYALDRKQNSVFVFDSNGLFVKKIDKYGSGPEEYTLLYDFGFNRFDGNLELMSATGYINVYDSLGEAFKHRIKLPDSIPAVSYFTNVSPGKYLFFSNSKEGNKILLYDAQRDRLIAEAYNIPKFIFFNTPYHHSYSPFYIYADTICFVQAYNGDVFSINNDGELKPRYLWDFMEYNFDISTLKEESIEFYVAHRRTVGSNYATCFLSYGENSKYYITSFSLRKKTYHLIIDKKKGKSIIFNTFKEGGVCFPVFMDESALYFYASPAEIDIAVNAKTLSQEAREKYNSMQVDDNPVVIKYTFK